MTLGMSGEIALRGAPSDTRFTPRRPSATQPVAALAETGTLMMCSRAGQERVASLLPPTHIAIVERKQIVPDLIDAFQMLGGRGAGQLPSNVTFITGPSKTGVIELQLTTGVHGPGQWRVIVMV